VQIMPDFYYLINVRSGLALDVAAEGGRGVPRSSDADELGEPS